MSIVRLRNDREVGDYMKPYVVAEMNTSHFGDMEIARNMIRQAKAAGCDCVKFQSWSAESLYCDEYYKNNLIASRIVKKFALENDQLKELSEYSREVGVDFSSTPYSIEEARFLVESCNVPFVKIASMELNNHPFLEQLGELGVPLVLSTGMGLWEEIIAAVDKIMGTGNRRLIVLHCTSVYPSSPEIIRLNNILALRNQFPQCPIGYSDHSIGIEVPAASIALGACLVEKHFTLDNKRIGMDNQMASEPEEMQRMISACHNVYSAMGGMARVLCEEERDMIPKMRRSMVSTTSLPAGTVLQPQHVAFKRPGTGISPVQAKSYIGKKILHDIEAGVVLEARFFED